MPLHRPNSIIEPNRLACTASEKNSARAERAMPPAIRRAFSSYRHLCCGMFGAALPSSFVPSIRPDQAHDAILVGEDTDDVGRASISLSGASVWWCAA
jgi:hypothetical protein